MHFTHWCYDLSYDRIEEFPLPVMMYEQLWTEGTTNSGVKIWATKHVCGTAVHAFPLPPKKNGLIPDTSDSLWVVACRYPKIAKLENLFFKKNNHSLCMVSSRTQKQMDAVGWCDSKMDQHWLWGSEFPCFSRFTKHENEWKVWEAFQRCKRQDFTGWRIAITTVAILQYIQQK